MNEKILSALSAITEEEQYILVQEDTDQRSLYSKSGRFIIERRHISSLSLGESTAAICIRPHPRFRAFPAHSHDYVEMMYVCSGKMTHIINGEIIELNTYDLIILGKDTKHSIAEAGECDIGINIIISTDLFESIYHSMKKASDLSDKQLEGIMRRNDLPFFVFSAKDNIEVQNIMESMIYTCLCKEKPNGYVLKQSIRLLLSYIAANSEGYGSDSVGDYKEAIKKKILDYVETSYSTATLVEASEMLGLSPSYLSRLVNNCFGVTFKSMLMSARFEAACAMLSSTDIPIGEIINRVGYENSSYFHKEFKKRYGTTPFNYRKNR